MDISLTNRAARRIIQSAEEAAETGDVESLYRDFREALNWEQLELLENSIDSGDLGEFLAQAVEEWDGSDSEEFLDLLANSLSELGIELKYGESLDEEVDDEEEDDEPLIDDEDVGVEEGEEEESYEDE